MQKKKYTAKDFYYFGIPLESEAVQYRAIKFFVFLNLIWGPMIGKSLEAYGTEFYSPLIGDFIESLAWGITFFSIFTLLLFKTKMYETFVYICVSLTFCFFSYLCIIYIFDKLYGAEVVSKGLSHQAFYYFCSIHKVGIQNGLLLLPLVGVGLSAWFYLRKLFNGTSREESEASQKAVKNTRNMGDLTKIFFPIFFSASLAGGTGLFYGLDKLVLIAFVFGIILFGAVVFITLLIAYIKFRFPEEYAELDQSKKKRKKKIKRG